MITHLGAVLLVEAVWILVYGVKQMMPSHPGIERIEMLGFTPSITPGG